MKNSIISNTCTLFCFILLYYIYDKLTLHVRCLEIKDKE